MAVQNVTDPEFDQALERNDKVIVKYFADWCGSCKLFAPKFKRLSNDDSYKGITFLEVNAEDNESARKKAGVSNLPYFAVFKNGELIEGYASSKEDAVVELLQKLN
jgi:thiol-disulfide isomerase/thioredoxin